MEGNIAAIYCRLSKEDVDKVHEDDESDSISNQKLLLINHAINQGYNIYEVYSDDDYSGMYNDRPSFEHLMKDAEEHKFNIVLSKTQSRFTRNMEHVERYLHNDFQRLGIRFIGVVDGVDTAVKSNKKARQINGLVNEWYCEDLSDNIKAVFNEKMKKGEFLGSFACYGYARDPKDRHKLIIDEEAANVVRRIFELSSKGYGVNLIAQQLSQMKIVTPTEYKKQNGFKYKNPNESKYVRNGIWSTTTIKRILNNEMYIGTLIQGRERKVSYKSKRIVIAPQSEWVIVKDNHAPIVTQEMFQTTQELIHHRRKTCKTTAGKSYIPHLFSGRIKCLDCHSTMAKTSGRLAGGHDYFICQLSRKSKQELCSRHSIRYDVLASCVEKRIRNLINQYYSEDYVHKHIHVKNAEKKIREQNNRINRCEEKIDCFNKSIASAYFDKVNGQLSNDEFQRIKNQLQKELENHEKEVKCLISELDRLEIQAREIETYQNIAQKYMNFKELTYEMLIDFIETIYIGEKRDGKQEIIIDWKV